MARREGYITEQVRRLNSGEINRRRFIMTALGAGVTMPTAMSLASRAEAQVPRRGGVLRVGMASGAATDRLDPGATVNAMMEALQFARGNGLVEIARSGALAGELAEEFLSPDGGRTWVFRLRPGIQFHDGKPLDAADVVATMEQQRRSASIAGALLADVGSVRADGSGTVVFDLVRPDVEFPWNLAEPQLVILPSRDGHVDPKTALGTGGYVLEHFEPGQRALLRRNPGYWKPDAAHVEAVDLIAMPDAARRQHAVMTGDVDLVDEVDPKTVALLSRVPNIEVLECADARLCLFPMGADTAPFGNRDLRLALKHAVDREDLVARALLGHGRPAADAPFSDGALEPVVADPERAAWHYRASGHSGPLTLGVSGAAFPGAAEAAGLIAASARKAGIEVVVGPAATGWWATAWRTRRSGVLAAALLGRAPCWTGTDPMDVGPLIAAARATPDSVERAALYERAARRIAEDGTFLVPMRANLIHVHSAALAHRGAADNRLAERWWFA